MRPVFVDVEVLIVRSCVLMPEVASKLTGSLFDILYFTSRILTKEKSKESLKIKASNFRFVYR